MHTDLFSSEPTESKSPATPAGVSRFDFDLFGLEEELVLDPFSPEALAAAARFEVAEDIPSSLLDNLNPRQLEAVSTLSGPLMVVAGPGSGKTTVLTRRIAALIATGIRPWQILAVTFTNKAANEMRERITSLVGADDAREMWVATFHSACVRILRANATAAGLPRSFSIVDSSDAQKLVRQVLVDLGVQAPDASLVREVTSAISWAKNAGRTAQDLAHSPRPEDRGYAPYMEAYNSRLSQMGAVDFDDLLLKTLHLLQTNADVLERYQRRFKHVLVDEYQDTNAVQYQIVQLLAAHYKNLCVVGDLDQCHPAGTMVQTVTGPVAIEDLDPNQHRLVSWARGERDSTIRGYGAEKDTASTRARRGFAFEVSSREHVGAMLTLTVEGHTVDLTPEHKVFMRWNKRVWEDRNHTALYLMRRGDWWRIGTSFLARSNQGGGNLFGPTFRARSEKADAVWVLDVFPTRREALIAEKQVAANFGLPTLVFEPPTSGQAAQPSADGLPPLHEDTLAKVFAGSEQMETKAHRLLAHYGRHPLYPFWEKGATAYPANGGSVYSKEVRASNLIAGAMDVPYEGEDHEIRWAVAALATRPFSGRVYSLNVDRHHNYVANKVVVSNCIYAFRGASPEAMAAFTADYPDGRVVILEQNYRSTQAILEVAQAVIDPNPAIHRPHLFTENPQGEPVRLYVASDDRDEADWVISEINKTKDPLKDHAILFRTNSQSRVFEETLTRKAMPYQVVGALRFYDRQEVKDALAYLRLAANPADAISFERCVNLPRRGLGDSSVSAILATAVAEERPVMDVVRTMVETGTAPGRSKNALAGFLEVYDTLLSTLDSGPVAALTYVVDGVDLKAHYRKVDKTAADDRLENLDELLASAKTFVTAPAVTSAASEDVASLPGREQVEAYLENVALVSSTDDDTSSLGRVSLMTAHASKGKEFPHVFVVGIEENLFPHARSKADVKAMEEERRLLFVAVSRAQKDLALSRAKSRYMFSKYSENKPSPFLDDLPKSVVIVKARPTLASTRPGQYLPSSPFARMPAVSPATRLGAAAAAPARRAAPAPTGPRLTVEEARVGLRVSHTTFGEGVINAQEGSRVTIEFPVGQKVLDLSFAPLIVV